MHTMSYIRLIIFILFLSLNPFISQGQGVDHWETVVFDYDIWSYRLGFAPPPANWHQPEFDDSGWLKDQGGFGYGDGDDNTEIPTTLSLYIRTKFEIEDLSKINLAVLHADYDDAFVAYLNGTEIARGNFGAPGTMPLHTESPDIDHEAALYYGGLPEAYAIPPNTIESLMQEGENTLAIQIHNFMLSSSDLSSNFFLSLGINDNSSDYRPTPFWFFEPFVGSHLPLVKVDTYGQGIPDEPRILANLQVIDNGEGELNYLDDPATDYDGRISIEIRGSSSQLFEKKNYGFETQNEVGNNNNVSLLGMPEENDWMLHGPYSDKSLIRNKLTFEIGREMMDYASRTRFVELMIDGDYRGIYVLMEKIKRDKNRVDISTLRPEDIEGDELTGGYIFQLDRDDESTTEDGWRSPYGKLPFYAYHSPGADQLKPIQKNYIRNWMTDFEFAMSQPFFASNYQNYIDVKSFVDYFLINELTKHIDAFKLSFYMYKRKDSNGGKLHMGPIWDFNLGYSNFDFACFPEPQGWIYPCTSRAFWLDRMVEIGAVRNRMYCRWQELREDKLSTENLMSRIDGMVEELGPAIERNFNRFDILGNYVWPNEFIGDSHEEEIEFLKDWLTQRLAWMDDNMYGDPGSNCEIVLDVDETEKVNSLKIFPNPFSDQITVSSNNNFHEGCQLNIFNSLGKLVHNSVVENEYFIELKSLPAGLYFYNLKIDQTIAESGKLIKQ